VSQLTRDLREAGVLVIGDTAQLQEDDFILVVVSSEYNQALADLVPSTAADVGLIRNRLNQAGGKWPKVIPLLSMDDIRTGVLRELDGLLAGDFRDETRYVVSLFDLVLSLYAISLDHPAFEPLRIVLQQQWEHTLRGYAGLTPSATASFDAPATIQEIFLSYSWGGQSEAIANELDQAFEARGVTIVRDKRSLGFRGRIREFMQRMGQGKCVILIIGERYLKSENCLFELLEVAKHGEFSDRVFPIVLEDAAIYKPIQRLGYVRYWEKQIKELDDAMRTVSAANLDGFREDIDLYSEIRAHLPRLSDILRDMNALTPEIHQASDFSVLFEAVMAKLSA
jgi:hypothetical protein